MSETPFPLIEAFETGAATMDITLSFTMIIVTTIRINETPKLTVRAMTKVLDPSLVHCELHPSPFCLFPSS